MLTIPPYVVEFLWNTQAITIPLASIWFTHQLQPRNTTFFFHAFTQAYELTHIFPHLPHSDTNSDAYSHTPILLYTNTPTLINTYTYSFSSLEQVMDYYS